MITIIAAIAPNRVIGHHGKLPWDLPEDLKLFKQYTSGNTVVMGRKTYESIGRPLPNRFNIVVSTTMEPTEGIDVCRSYDEAISKAQEYQKEIFIIGGARIYAEAMKNADRLLISHVKDNFEGDTFFPEWDPAKWNKAREVDYDKFVFVEYTK